MSDDRAGRYPTPREFVDDWETLTDNQRLARAERIINDAQIASTCFVMNHDKHLEYLEQALKSATTPQTAGGASARDQAISQAPPTREGSRGRPRPPVDVPAPPLPTTKETT
jgi:hypothetical protein